MNYDEFAEELREEVELLIHEEIDDAKVVIRTVTKNNNVKMKALSIIRKDERATPTIYIRNYYEAYRHGRDMSDICREIVCVYESGLNRFNTNFNVSDLLDFNAIKSEIFYKLVNYDMNVKMLEDVPHFRYLDMAIVFMIMVSCDDCGQASIMIQNSYLEKWDITPRQLKEIAFKNTWNKYPPVIKKMEDIVTEMILGDIVDEENGEFLREDLRYGDFDYDDIQNIIREEVEKLKEDRNMEMFVLTNNIRNNGAACITYPGVLKQFAKEHGCDIFIIPSSIHEVILIPGNDWDRKTLDKMVVEVNDGELDPVEILSYHTYIYSREDEEIYY